MDVVVSVAEVRAVFALLDTEGEGALSRGTFVVRPATSLSPSGSFQVM